MADPAASKPSYETGVARSVTTGAATPGSTALTSRPDRAPEPTASITSPSGVPSSISPTSGASTSPTTVQTRFPGEAAVPDERNQSAPRASTCVTLQSVSTLLTSVGFAAAAPGPRPSADPSQPVTMSRANSPCSYGGNSRG